MMQNREAMSMTTPLTLKERLDPYLAILGPLAMIMMIMVFTVSYTHLTLPTTPYV